MSALYLCNVKLLNTEGAEHGSIRVEKGRIAAVNAEMKSGDHRIDGEGGLLIPGLINAHDHLEFNTIERLKFRDSYDHSTQWFDDFKARMDSDPAILKYKKAPLDERLFVGGMKNLLSGVTTVCHHNDYYPSLKNSRFPVVVLRDYAYCHSLFLDDPQASYARADQALPWIIHLAEGIDAKAEGEFETLWEQGLIQPNTILVHGVGLNESQRLRLLDQGGGLIWCPGSNDFLFKKTAEVTALAQAGKVALATDSRLSGEFDMLAELKKAADTGQLTPQQLFSSITRDAAAMLRLGDRGSLEKGARADLVLLPPPAGDPHAALIGMQRNRIRLVLIAGQAQYSDPCFSALFKEARRKASPCRVDGKEKLLWKPLMTRHDRCSVQERGLES